MISRADYIAGEVTHEVYYSQFVNQLVKNYVQNSIGLDRILNSKDPSFNDIPLKEWDAMRPMISMGIQRNIVFSLSDCVCIAKQAARIIKEEAMK